MQDLFRQMRARTDAELIEGALLKDYTTFRIGGPADVLALPRTEAELLKIVSAARLLGAQVFVLGNGSNLLVRDGGVRGVVIALKHLSEVRTDGVRITAQAGALLPAVAARALKEGLSGLEFASGIPGSLGGAIRMNAGAYGGQMSDVALSARVLRGGQVVTLSKDELALGYRTSAIRDGDVLIDATLELSRGDKGEIARTMDDLNARRRDKQPLNYPSAGSTFKRPPGHFAGALIEVANLKGVSVGGAQVSEKHAGFIVNTGGATAADVLRLISHVQAEVLKSGGVVIETEVHIVGEDPK